MNSDFSHVFSSLRKMALLPAVCFAAGLVGCSSSTPSANTQVEKASAVTSDALLKEGVMAKGLTKDQGAETPTNDFAPSDPICLSLKLNGRPKTGLVNAKFYIDTTMVSETTIDIATLNKDVLFSVGETTNVGFSFTHKKPFPVDSKYRIETFFDSKPLATYKFNVVAPAGEAPAKSSDEAPASKE